MLAARQEVAEEQARLKERELDTEIRKPADAQRYAVEQGAEADGVAEQARREASAEAMQKRADAYEAYGEAAVADLMIQAMPEIVRAASEPLSAIDRMTVISTDGASQVTRSATSNITQLLQLATDVTGIDLTELLASVAAKASGGTGATSADGAEVVETTATP